MAASRLSRRRALSTAAATAALPLVHIRTAGAAGKLVVGLTDHWVIEGNDCMRRLVQEWADRNKVDVALEFVTSTGGKNLLTLATEAQSRTGHDIRAFPTWMVHQYADRMEPMDDVMGRLTATYGPVSPVNAYLARIDGVWRAIPCSPMSKHMASCARLDVFRDRCGIDVQAMYPARAEHTAASDGWTYDAMLAAAPACRAAGMPLGLTLSNAGDAVDWCGSLFAGFGAQLVGSDGQVTVRSDAVRAVLAYAQTLVPHIDPGVFGWDGAGNNRALISGRSALIFDAPSAWSVAKKDAPHVAEAIWGFPNPAGPAGRFVPYVPIYWGVWSFASNKSAAKDLLEHLSQREQVQAMANATHGYDIPPFQSMTDFDVWEREGPPAGLWFNYPVKPHHHAQTIVAGYPAPPEIAVQIYNNATMPQMIQRVGPGGMSVDAAIAWAEGELASFARG
ncbi:MAG: extracellular solute-binding protein [Acetobacteraceae bacterium]|nr:extracellular solute-binding protein [Acetobacteraceae bacterium]